MSPVVVQLEDAGVVTQPEDAGVEPAPSAGTFSSTGETCLGSSDLELACEPEICLAAHYVYTNLNVDPALVGCVGDSCSEPLTDPNAQYYTTSRLDRLYQILTPDAPNVWFQIAMSVDIASARNAEEAQRTITFARAMIGMPEQARAYWSDTRNNDIGTTSVQVLRFENRRIYLRAHNDARKFAGSYIPTGLPCIGGIEGACGGGGCQWADATSGGSGTAPTVDFELEFTLPPNVKIY